MKLFTENEIIETYNKYVKKDKTYYDKANLRYKQLSDFEKRKFFPMDFPRVASFFDFCDWIEKYQLNNLKSMLSTCDKDPELQFLDIDNISYYQYYGNGDGDLHTMNMEKKDFDLILFNQTLEHLYNPFICMKNLYQHLKPGGYLYTTVPTINIPHMVPFHFWGITPIGLCMLSKSVGFSIKECGFWGNYEYLGYLFTYGNWPNNEDVKDNDGYIKNTDLCQAQTWILLQK